MTKVVPLNSTALLAVAAVMRMAACLSSPRPRSSRKREMTSRE